MALVIPNLEASPSFDAQAIPDATDVAALSAAFAEAGGWLSSTGSASVAGSMNVGCWGGRSLVNGKGYDVGGASKNIGAASATDRRDIIVWTAGGTGWQVIAGTPCGTAGWSRSTTDPLTNPPPIKPAIPANSVLYAEVYVAYNTTSITAANLIDKSALLTRDSPAARLFNRIHFH
jgi:hypothetical protein